MSLQYIAYKSGDTDHLEELYAKYFNHIGNKITIELKNGKTFSVNKDILTVQSDVFKSMFLSGMQEEISNTIVMNKHSPAIVKAFFDYMLYRRMVLYEDKCIAQLFELLDMTNMYQQTAYYNYLVDIIRNNTYINNAYGIITLTSKYQGITEKIYDKCYRLIRVEFYQYITTETICFDDIAPGETTSKGVLRPSTLGSQTCCKHMDTTKDYLQKPTKHLNIKGRYLCIAHTMEKNDPQELDCIKTYCCQHRDATSSNRHKQFLSLPEEIQQQIIGESLGSSLCDLIKKLF